MLGLYVHIPFCRNICTYCDFYKMVVSDTLKAKFIEYLGMEIELQKLHNYDFDTIYIGGGTPSCLPLSLLAKLLQMLSENINLAKLKEFTMEVNPEDITEELVKLISRYHVSRISIGVQTFQPRLLKTIGRHTEFEDIKTKITLLRSFNINNINLDLIYALPGETIDDVETDLEKFISLKPEHLSTYSLILEDHTILKHQYDLNKINLVSEESDRLMYDLIKQRLKDAGYFHYETSNFALSGHESVHNLIYWKCNEYLAIGPASSSYYHQYRKTATQHLDAYFDGLDNLQLAYQECEYIDTEMAMKEELMLGLRLTEGVSRDEFLRKFGTALEEHFSIAPLIKEGLLEIKHGNLRIPDEYQYIANYIIVKLI